MIHSRIDLSLILSHGFNIPHKWFATKRDISTTKDEQKAGENSAQHGLCSKFTKKNSSSGSSWIRSAQHACIQKSQRETIFSGSSWICVGRRSGNHLFSSWRTTSGFVNILLLLVRMIMDNMTALTLQASVALSLEKEEDKAELGQGTRAQVVKVYACFYERCQCSKSIEVGFNSSWLVTCCLIIVGVILHGAIAID